MSKNSEKGRKGELAVTAVFSNLGVHESGIEVIRTNNTTTPDRGVDIALKCPHNLSQKLDEIAAYGNSKIALSKAQIDVRIQVKNYTKPISKAVAKSFVDEIYKNPTFAEHWGAGGTRLTKGAQEVIKEANKIAPVKWYVSAEIEKIQENYPTIPFTGINENIK